MTGRKDSHYNGENMNNRESKETISHFIGTKDVDGTIDCLIPVWERLGEEFHNLGVHTCIDRPDVQVCTIAFNWKQSGCSITDTLYSATAKTIKLLELLK